MDTALELGTPIDLTRNGVYWDGSCWQNGVIDNLSYTSYSSSNRLQFVDENATGTLASYGFKQSVSSGSTAYQYDANGNLAYDLNKNMDITYNHLNLPERIEFDDCKVIDFTYDANGTKLRKELKNGAMLLSNHEYLGSIEYEGSELRNIYHEEGRVYYEGGTGRYEFNIQDHLGNTRLTFTDKDGDGTIEISSDPEVSEVLQENHYYPFGMSMDGQWMANAGRDDKYQYNGKELNEDFGLNWYDYGARFYDPAIGRFTGIDILADTFPSWTPYHYTLDNPINMIDPDGRAPDWIYDQQADGSYKRREGVANDGGVNFHTYNNNDGTTSYHNVQAGTFVTVDNSEMQANFAEYQNTSDGERVGKGLQILGDGIAVVGYAGAPFTEGTSLALSLFGEGISLTGKVVENVAKLLKDGATTENIIDAGVDTAFELAPPMVEQPLKKLGVDKAAKANIKIIQAQDRKVFKAMEYSIDKKIEEARGNN